MPDFYLKINPPFQKLASAYQKAGKNLNIAFKDIIEEFAFLTERYGKQVTPVKTGRLRSSISVSFPISDQGKSARIGTWGVNYAVFVHEGTKFMHARPFLKWGMQFASQKFNDNSVSLRLDKQLREDLSTL